MNDRFKFRIWDEERENMFYLKDKDDYIEIDCNRELIGYDTAGAWVGGHNCIPMQCTGLKDKNGKLIYEGDIVEVIPDKEYAVIKWNNESVRFDIRIKNSTSIYRFTTFCGDELEVIGNIYENPELLNSEELGIRSQEWI